MKRKLSSLIAAVFIGIGAFFLHLSGGRHGY